MSDERRDDDRSPDFRSVELVTTNGHGNEKAYPVTLRDTSGNGLGGMYVGEEVLSPTATFVLRESEEDEDRRVRIVWTKRVADYVQMMGLEVSET
jgi:hypothetical protein